MMSAVTGLIEFGAGEIFIIRRAHRTDDAGSSYINGVSGGGDIRQYRSGRVCAGTDSAVARPSSSHGQLARHQQLVEK